MGADIHGWVEVKELPPGGYQYTSGTRYWNGVIRIRYLVERSYRVFAILFGMRNTYGVVPLAAGRGLPNDRSVDTKLDLENGMVGITWALWSELKTVDWAQLPPHLGIRQGADGEQGALPRAAYIPQRWEALFQMMEALAGPYGDENVRLVVWFDQE